MNLSQLKNPTWREWAYFIVAVVLWVWFVLPIPCELHYPWNVFVKFLVILSPFFWYKSLKIDYRTQREREIGPTDSPRALNKPTAERLIYTTIWALAWGTLVFNIPGHPFSYKVIVNDILGFLAPFLLLVRLRIDPDLVRLVSPRVNNASSHARKPQFADTPVRMPWILFFSSEILWVLFVNGLPDEPHHYPGAGFWHTISIFSLCTWIWALPWALSVGTKIDTAARISESDQQNMTQEVTPNPR